MCLYDYFTEYISVLSQKYQNSINSIRKLRNFLKFEQIKKKLFFFIIK